MNRVILLHVVHNREWWPTPPEITRHLGRKASRYDVRMGVKKADTMDIVTFLRIAKKCPITVPSKL